MSNIIPFEGSKLPAFLKNAQPTANELAANVGGGGFPVMSIKGKQFALTRGGERKTLMNPNDPDEVATSINVVILKANPNLSKIWYAKGYTEGSDSKPDCFSNDGIAPDPSVEKPQSKKCSTCSKNEWGSKVSEDGKKMKACQDSRRLAVAAPDRINDPILLRVPAATLKPLAEYGNDLAKRSVPYSAVVTKVGFDRDAAAPKLTFKPVGFLSEEQYGEVQDILKDEVLASILGKPGEAPVMAEETTAEPPAPAEEAKPAKVEKPVKEEPVAEKPKAAKKPEPKVVEEESSLEAELEGLLDELDD